MNDFAGWVEALLAAAFLGACQSAVFSGRQDDGGRASTSVAASAAAATSAAGGSTGAGSSATSGSTSSGSSTSGTGSSGASTTGGSSTGLPSIIDGGYVFCAVDGAAGWTCWPGTYFCELDGGPGDGNGGCLQCRSDADCMNESLPTYDPNRLHCDISSGFQRYQNYCQQCIEDANCAGNPAGSYCFLQSHNPGMDGLFPYESPIFTSGYETCGKAELDCRADGGDLCRGLNEYCDTANGDCRDDTGICQSDSDCTGYLQGNLLYGVALAPYCLNGGCSSCEPDGGNCGSVCQSDAGCPNGMSCVDSECFCNRDDQCSPDVPVCFVDGGQWGGQVVGLCGCDQDDQCGDAGLACLFENGGTLGFCGPPCTATDYPLCLSIAPTVGFCDSLTGLCAARSSDAQCQSSPNSGGPHCVGGGICGCAQDSECPVGEVCASGQCTLPDPPCESDCTGVTPVCATDRDCATSKYAPLGSCCANGVCGACPPPPNACTTDADCAHNPVGTSCDITFGTLGYQTCGCEYASSCDYKLAFCDDSSSGSHGICEPACDSKINCPVGLSCGTDGRCRARCDDGGICPANMPVCDEDDRAGLNGESGKGALPAVVWCYGCAGASDCPLPLGCGADTAWACAACAQDSDCRPGEACLDGGGCRSLCDAGVCPEGEVCDINDAAGGGSGICYQCLGPSDCPGNEGCNSQTRTCGSCHGPAFYDTAFDCPPDDICSNYWSDGPTLDESVGSCLQNCDVRPCPGGTTCAVVPALTSYHAYCFECLQDSDCADVGPGAWCNLLLFPTFTCEAGPRP